MDPIDPNGVHRRLTGHQGPLHLHFSTLPIHQEGAAVFLGWGMEPFPASISDLYVFSLHL